MRNICLLVMLLVATAAMGQIEDNQTDLLKPFKAKLAKSKKFEATPHMPTVDTTANKNQNYIVPTHLMGVSYPAPSIRPLAMPKSKPPEAHTFYAKAGFGYPLSPLVEMSYHNKNIKNFKFGATARHHSVLKGYLPNQQFTQTGAKLNATYFTNKNLAIGGHLGFNYNTNRFYGMDSLLQETVTEDSLRQSFFNIEGNLNIFNGKSTKANFNYRGDVDFYYYADRFRSSEFSITPKVMIEKWFGKGKKKHPLRVEVGLNHTGFKDSISVDSISNSTNILMAYFHPTFTINAGAFKARLGVNLGVNESKFFIHPDVELSYAVAKGMLTIYGGAVGQVRQNNFRSFTRLNPFLSSSPEIHHTNYLEFFGGARGSIKKIGYDIKAGYALTQNLPYFLNNSDTITGGEYWRFKTVYDTTGIIFVRGGLDFRLVKNLVVGGVISYNIYNTRNYEKAWHLPTFESNFFIEYNLFFKPNKKPRSNFLTMRAELFFNAGVPYLDESNNQQVLQGLYDFSFGLNYQITKNFAIFLDVNNIIHNRNQRWYRYRQLGFNGMVDRKSVV